MDSQAALEQQALEQLRRGDLRAAHQTLSQLYHQRPEDDALRRRIQQVEHLIQQRESRIQSEPLRYAQAYIQAGRLAEGLQLLRSALARDPGNQRLRDLALEVARRLKEQVQARTPQSSPGVAMGPTTPGPSGQSPFPGGPPPPRPPPRMPPPASTAIDPGLDARIKADAARRQAEAKATADARAAAEAAARADAEARARAEADAKARVEARARAEAETKKREADARAKREAEERARQEAVERARREAEARARKEGEERARKEAEERARREAEERTRRDEERARQFAEEKARREAERRAEEARREADIVAAETERLRKEGGERSRRDAEQRAAEGRRLAEQAAAEAARKQAGTHAGPRTPGPASSPRVDRRSPRQRKIDRLEELLSQIQVRRRPPAA